MDKIQLIQSIELALKEINILVNKSKHFRANEEPILSTILVLNSLKANLIEDSNHLNERILRAMHDIGMSSFKEFENTPLEEAIINIISILSQEVPYYLSLEPLRGDFGKGFPI